MGIFSSIGGMSFNPSKDIPSLAGKVILVTGGNAGLGKQSIIELSKHQPAQIWLAARSLSKANEAVADIKEQVPDAPVKVLELDLQSLESVQNAAKLFSKDSPRLDILLLNAGIMAHPPGLTKDGYEVQFGTNHVGHALLTKLLIPVLLRTAEEKADSDVRVIVLSSAGHSFAPAGGIHFNTLKSKAEKMATLTRYGQSKLANILFAQELAKRYPQLKTASVHPGVVNTNLTDVVGSQGNILFRIATKTVAPLMGVSVVEGVKTQLWASTVEDLASGEYYEPVGVAGRGTKDTKDQKLAQELWEWTEKELSGF